MSFMSRAAVAAIALSIALAAPGTASAQSTTTFNLGGGLSLANGDFGDRNDAGYSLIVGIGMRQSGSPFGLRAEGIYTEYDQKFLGGKARAGGILGSATYDFAVGFPAFVPYAIGGIGFYSTREPVSGFDTESETNVGWNLGGGVRIPLSGFSAYFEGRYHSVSNAGVAFAPIVFGVRF